MFDNNSLKIKATKVLDGKYIYVRTMYGSLSGNIDLDLSKFTLPELESVLTSNILPLFDEELKVYRGGQHIRIYKNIDKSSDEGILFIGDSPIIIDDMPLVDK